MFRPMLYTLELAVPQSSLRASFSRSSFSIAVQRPILTGMPPHPQLNIPASLSKPMQQSTNELSSSAARPTRDPSGLKYVEPKPMESSIPHEPTKHGRVRCFSLCGGEKSRTGKLLSHTCCACCSICSKCMRDRRLPGWIGCCMRCFACRSIDRVSCH